MKLFKEFFCGKPDLIHADVIVKKSINITYKRRIILYFIVNVGGVADGNSSVLSIWIKRGHNHCGCHCIIF